MPRDVFAAIGGTSQRGEPGGVNVGVLVALWRRTAGVCSVALGALPLAPGVTT